MQNLTPLDLGHPFVALDFLRGKTYCTSHPGGVGVLLELAWKMPSLINSEFG